MNVAKCGCVWTSFVCVIMVLHCLVLPPADGKPCGDAQTECANRVGCSMALHSYFLHCSTLTSGETNQCSLRCQEALVSLLSTEDQKGENFVSCSCGGNKYCQSQKRRMELCSSDVLVAMKSIYDEGTVITCSLAQLICQADTSCYTALRFYEQRCRKLFSGDRCTSKCNNSISILYGLAKAQKLRTCVCDGTESYDCPKLKSDTNRLCFNNRHPPPPQFVTPDTTTTTRRHKGCHHDPKCTKGGDATKDIPKVTKSASPNAVEKHVASGSARVIFQCYAVVLCLVASVVIL